MIPNERLKYVAEKTEIVQRNGLWIPLLCGWLLMLLTFSAPGREGPSSLGSLDAIALAKVAVRIMGICLLGMAIARAWHYPQRRVVDRCLLPLGLFVGWSLLSTCWSPLKLVSFGQIGGLLVQVMLTFVVAVRCTGPKDLSKILYHLSLAMLTFSAVVLIINAVSHEASGLVRGVSIEGSIGFVHPTAAGATASLGIVILVAARLLWDWRWSRILLMPALVIHSAMLVLSISRIAIAMCIVTLLLSFLLLSRRFVITGVITLACIVMAGYIAIDPGFELTERTLASVAEYARRGEPDEQLRTINGRTILWEAIWNEFKKSPLIGHGYFITSQHGLIDVWDPSNPSNKTAHNILLQVLASTGVIGILLFLWGLIKPVKICSKFLMGDSQGRKLAAFLGLLGIWYFGWGLFCSSFMGPVQPESVVFFMLLGLALGSLHSPDK